MCHRFFPFLVLIAAASLTPSARAQSFPVSISIDAAAPGQQNKPIWRFFGADEPNYAYMPNGAKLIKELGELRPKDVYFRAHNLLCTGDGTPALKWGSTNVYTEDASGKPIYDWTLVDRIFDTYIQRGVRPYAQIGFMPKALSTKPEPYQHKWSPTARYETIFTGWAYPPTDYAKWAELVYQWTKHCVDKYGKEEVEHWYWETWNEPNIGYWKGTPQEFRKLHDYAVDAVRRALPTARVGGPDSAGGGQYLKDFLEHCVRGTNAATGKTGTPTDFVSFHAKGAPTFVDGHVRMGIANQLRGIDRDFGIIASFPELKNKPIVIGESDPDGCAACVASEYPQNGYRNGTHFASYTAAVFARKLDLAEKHGVNLDGALTWAFEFEDQPIFAGYRTLATGGIDKPVLNAFRMFSKLSGQRLPAPSDGAVPLETMLRTGVREKPDVSAMASRDGNRLAVMLWHYHDDDVAGPEAKVALKITGLPAGAMVKMVEYRIDESHSNAFTAWKNMGSPQQPTPQQYAELEKAGQLQTAGEPHTHRPSDGAVNVAIDLPRQALALLEFTWDR